MLAKYRAVLHDLCRTGALSVAVWDTIPDDLAELPCVVIGRPAATPSSDAGVFELVAEVFVIARRQQAGDYEKELLDLTDETWTLLGGTTGAPTMNGYNLSLRAIAPRILTVAGNEVIAYAIGVVSSESTC
jgi:hypothetical protein